MTEIPENLRKAFEEKFLLTHYKDGTTERHGLRCKTEELLEFIHSQREEAVREVIEEVKRLHRYSESKSAEHECSQEGYEYALEDVLKFLPTSNNPKEHE